MEINETVYKSVANPYALSFIEYIFNFFHQKVVLVMHKNVHFTIDIYKKNPFTYMFNSEYALK